MMRRNIRYQQQQQKRRSIDLSKAKEEELCVLSLAPSLFFLMDSFGFGPPSLFFLPQIQTIA
jgi:hypothetical protein